jgi:hypothetical protein
LSRAARLLGFAAALAQATACAFVGYDLGDYGGTSGAPVDAAGDDGGPPADADTTLDSTVGGDNATPDGNPPADATVDAPSDATGTDTGTPGLDTGTTGDANKADGPDTCTLGNGFKRVFVTSATYSVIAIGSVNNADVLCSFAAVNFNGTFKAWISDEGTSASARLTHATVPYVLVDNATIVACDWTALTTQPLRHAIDLTENASLAPASPGCGSTAERAVFTGTQQNGLVAPGHTCTNWADSAGVGLMGFAPAVAQDWTDGCAGAVCGGTGSLYCFEQ